MNLNAKLFVCGEERELLHTNIHYFRRTDEKAKVISALLGGFITVTFEAQMYDDNFVKWITANRIENKKIVYPFNRYTLRDGKVVFYEKDFDNLALFEYNFKDGALVKYHETFDNQKGLQVTLTISPAMQDYRFFNNSSHWREQSKTRYMMPWKESYLPPIKPSTYKSKETETPVLVACYYTDLEGNKQAIPTTGQEIYVVLKTKNTIGKIIDVDLSNHTKDFMYNGEILENDTIKNVKVTANTHKIKLRVIAQQKGEKETIKQ